MCHAATAATAATVIFVATAATSATAALSATTATTAFGGIRFTVKRSGRRRTDEHSNDHERDCFHDISPHTDRRCADLFL